QLFGHATRAVNGPRKAAREPTTFLVGRDSKRFLDPTSEGFCCKSTLIGACGWPRPIDCGGQSSYELRVTKIGRLGDALQRFTDHVEGRDLGSKQKTGYPCDFCSLLCPGPRAGKCCRGADALQLGCLAR